MKKMLIFSGLLLVVNALFAQAWLVSPTNSNNIYNPNFSTLGLVGIGTNSPGFLLDVNGIVHTNSLFLNDEAQVGGIGAWIRGATNGSGNIVLQSNGGTGIAFWLTGANGYLKMGGSGGSELATGAINVDGTGHVGIGTLNTAGYTFNVNGTAVFDQVTVKVFSAAGQKTSPWADYVFDKAYKLPSLDSIAAYIKTNHHLPGIPTAAEVEKNGLDLGANQAGLLEKIEQLTLYTIQLQQQVDSLQAQNAKFADLQSRLEKLEARSHE